MAIESNTRVSGLLESAQLLVNVEERRWNQAELLQAAQKAELRNTGWPIGLVFQRGDLRPVVMSDCIEQRLAETPADGWDYWRFKVDGSYYVAREFEEESGKPGYTSVPPPPQHVIWFDIRIWRIAEVLLHSATVYRELGVPPDEPYLLAVRHSGLLNREFYTSDFRRFVTRGRISSVDNTNWTKEVTRDYVLTNLKELTGEIAAGLFVLFDFASVGKDVIDEIVDEFLRRGAT